MRIWKLTAALLGAALLAFAACAPVDEPLPTPGTGDAPGARDSSAKDDPAAPPSRAVPVALKDRLEAAILNVRRRDLMTTNAFWTVFHGILGLGPGVELMHPQLKLKVNALDYICDGGELRGLRFTPTPYGVEVNTLRDSIGQGHDDQFIAEMAQWGMPPNRKIVVQGREFTFMDFVKQSQMRARVKPDQELSWTILVVGQYVGLDVSWTNGYGEKLHFEDLVRAEVEASVEQAPCGGTHRLFGLTWVYHLHLQQGGKTEGVWKAIADRTARYRDNARQSQNPDGALSTSYFQGWGNSPDKQLRINTTGHMLEWLALAVSDEELKMPWVQNAAGALASLILDLQGGAIDAGSMYHAVHGLQIYYARVYDRSFCPPELRIPLPPGWGTGKKN
jgi:hypothetical protein